MRADTQFCIRCGKSYKQMREGRRVVFVEDHTCDAKDVLVYSFKRKELYEKHPWMKMRDEEVQNRRTLFADARWDR